jgi:ATP-binding cassette subfamily B multidrug efflux pump
MNWNEESIFNIDGLSQILTLPLCKGEKYIQDAMDEVMKNKTFIVIAHRLPTIAKMNKIIVMDNWEIVEKRSYNALIQNENWIYHKLWSIQSWGFLTNDNKLE